METPDLFGHAEAAAQRDATSVGAIQHEAGVRALAAMHPFSLVCACDADGPATYDQAIALGWKDIEADLDGMSWNFLGT